MSSVFISLISPPKQNKIDETNEMSNSNSINQMNNNISIDRQPINNDSRLKDNFINNRVNNATQALSQPSYQSQNQTQYQNLNKNINLRYKINGDESSLERNRNIYNNRNENNENNVNKEFSNNINLNNNHSNIDNNSNSQSSSHATLKMFLLEQIAFQSGNNSEYVVKNYRKALRNLGDQIVTTPGEAKKIKGVGAKTLERFTKWLTDKGIITSNASQSQNNEISSSQNQDNISMSQNSNLYSDSLESNEINSRKRKRYIPKEGSVPSAILYALSSYYRNYEKFPSKKDLVSMVRQRHNDKQKTTISSSITNLAINQGVIIEINGVIELTTEGWEVVGGIPPGVEPRQGEIRKKTLDPPRFVELHDSQLNRNNSNSTLEKESISSDEEAHLEAVNSFPIKISYADEEGHAVSDRIFAKFKYEESTFHYYICVVFPLLRIEEIRASIKIEDSIEMQSIRDLGLLYGWIPENSITHSNDLGEIFFPSKKPIIKPILSATPSKNLTKELETVNNDFQNTSQNSPTISHIQLELPTQTENLDSNIVTYSFNNTSTYSNRRIRRKLIEITTKKSDNSVIRENFSMDHTSRFNKITYNGIAYEIILLVDHRERIKNNRDAFISQVQEKIHADRFELALGDFLWVAKPVNGAIVSSLLFDIVVERKTANDLAHSIFDGRKRNQNYRMKNLGFSKILYIIEGKLTGVTYTSPTAILQSMTNMIIRDRFTVIETSSCVDTMNFLYSLTSYLIERVKVEGLEPFLLKQENSSVNVLQYNELGKKNSYQSYSEILGRQIFSLKRCTGDAAIAIVEKYPSIYELYKAMEDTNSESSREKLIQKNVIVPSLGHLPAEQIPFSLSKKICDLFTLNSYGNQSSQEF